MTNSEITPAPSTAILPSGYIRLNEDAIKRIFIPHLKEFYKYRYVVRTETLNTSLDNVSGQGLVADGLLTFNKADGTPFVCTYEATSLEKSGEVKFSLNAMYFVWDCLSFSAISTAVLYAWFYYARLPWLSQLKLAGNLGLLFGFATMAFFAWYYLLRGWPKYRYIYAVEQFKHYFAHEQWIALGEDVFPAPTDPYFAELKRQCIYNGFGLAVVYSNGGVRNIATPSRLGIFGKERKMVQWITRNDWYKAMSQNVAFAKHVRPEIPGEIKATLNKLWRPLHHQVLKPLAAYTWKFFKDPLNDSNTAFDRYMRGRSVQQWIFGFGLFAIALLGYYVSRFSTENYIDPDTLLNREKGPNPEDQPGYIIDGDPVPYNPRGIPKQYPAHNKSGKRADEEDIQVINLSGEE